MSVTLFQINPETILCGETIAKRNLRMANVPNDDMFLAARLTSANIASASANKMHRLTSATIAPTSHLYYRFLKCISSEILVRVLLHYIHNTLHRVHKHISC